MEVQDKNGNRINVSDQWVGSVPQREYGAGDFYTSNIPSSLNVNRKLDVDQIALNIPEGLKEGEYTVKVTAVNDNNPTANTEWAQKFTVYDSSISSKYIELPKSTYMKQNKNNTCTLSSATMMMQSYAYRNGSSEYASITEENTSAQMWTNQMHWSNTYSASGNEFHLSTITYDTPYKTKYTPNVSHALTAQNLKNLLDHHPEGVVIYDYCSDITDNAHAVFVTRYEGDTFYCADPSYAYGKDLKNYSGKELTLSQSSLGARRGNQDKVLENIHLIAYVNSNTKIVK